MAGFAIFTDYPGANIHVLSIKDDVVRLEQDMRDSAGWWFYWSFGVQAGQAQTVHFEFMNGEVIGPWGPAVSTDGETWSWLGADSVPSSQAFRYTFKASEKIRFCFSIPYQVQQFESFFSHIQGHPLVRRRTLVPSEQGRSVPLLQLGNPAADKHLVFTCRHHACESTSSYVLEGIIDYYLNEPDSPVLGRYELHVIPFVDMDGVENGDQGKSRIPHDHNRDYTASPIYQTTAAVMRHVNALSLAAGIDLHCPYKWGGRNDAPFIVKKYSPGKEEQERFGAILKTVTRQRQTPDPILYDPCYDIEMGEDWNQPHGHNCSAFFERRRAKLACTFEFPYFGWNSNMITQANCRRFGADFAKALEAYLLEGCL